jgi:hypothetical protein
MAQTKQFLTRLLCALPLVLVLANEADAANFAEGSQAKSWNLNGEEKALFSGKVVDVLCHLSGDCPANCGDGKRNLGILRDTDGHLVLVLKNGQPAFNGAADDLLPYCGKQVDVDGLLVGDDEVVSAKFYQVQLIRVAGEEQWNPATLWTKRWAEKNPDAEGKGPWFRRDPRVKKQIAKSGHFGLGHEEDRKFIEENQ